MKKFIIEVTTNWCGEGNQYGAYAKCQEDIEDIAQMTAWENFIGFSGIEGILEELFPEVEDEEYTDEQRSEAEERESEYFSYTIREVDGKDDEETFGYLEIIWDARAVKNDNNQISCFEGCDHDCANCHVPSIDPEDCENCLREAEESGFEYERNFTYEDGCWICANCRQPV